MSPTLFTLPPGVGGEDALRRAGLRATRSRLAVMAVLRSAGDVDLTIDQALERARSRGTGLTVSTLYNVLNDFARAGLVRRLPVGTRAVYCCNPGAHHHFLDMATGRVSDIADPQPLVTGLPPAPEGMEVEGVDVFVRLRPAGTGRG